MDELRWFLLVVGLVVIIAVYLYGRMQDWRQDGAPWSRRRRENQSPFSEEDLSESDLRDSLDELDTLITERQTEIRPPERRSLRESVAGAEHGDAPPRRGQRRRDREPLIDPEQEHSAPRERPDDFHEPSIADEPVMPEDTERRPEPGPRHAPEPRENAAAEAPPQDARENAPEGPVRGLRKPRLDAVSDRLRQVFSAGREDPAEEATPAPEPAPVGEEKIIVLNLMAPEGTHFAGPALAEALQHAGMRHGEHDIFHRTLQTRSGTIALYSAANAVKPGSFDLADIDNFDTPGIAFFLQLPGPFDGLAAFEQMLQAARGTAAELGGHLLDSRRCDLTQQSIEHVREELLEYRRRAHLAARQAR